MLAGTRFNKALGANLIISEIIFKSTPILSESFSKQVIKVSRNFEPPFAHACYSLHLEGFNV